MRSLLAAALLLLVPVAVFAQPLPARVRDAAALQVATYPNYPPMTFRDPATNARQGFDVELIEAIGKELGVAVQWQDMPFVQFIPALQTGRIDLAIDGIGDLPARRESVDFVDYLRAGARFFTLAANDAIRAPRDLCGKRVGASRSTSWPADIAAWSDAHCKPDGLPPMEVIGTEGSIDTRTQLRTGRLDGGVQGTETMGWLARTDPGLFRPLGEAFTTVLVGIPVAKAEAPLRDAVRAALQRMMDRGDYAALLAKWDLTASALPRAGVNGQ